jgi:Trk-type K+ transport system membrane component
VDRAFAIISLSLIVIGIGILLVSAAEPEQTNFLDIAFEVFSSYSTVGLSLGITPKLTDFSKFVLIFVMFIGRVGALNILIGMLRQIKTLPYRYPEESVIIN